MKKNRNKHFVLLLSLSIIFCLIATSCLPFLATVGGIIFNFSNHLSENRIIVYGNENDLSVTFRDGKMLAIWDSSSSYDYVLTVTNGDEETTFESEEGLVDLSSAGFDYGDNLFLDLAKSRNSGTTHFYYEYEPLSSDDYATYAAPVKAGFSEIDRYIATRAEWFDYFSYLIVFREGAKETEESDGTTTYLIETSCHLAYDYTGFAQYNGLTEEECLENEVFSAIDAYEDSASYAYSYALEKDKKTAQLYLKFYYLNDPDLETDTSEKYMNATKPTDRANYSTDIRYSRTFLIDSVEKTIVVSSTDQLYFALKKGYRPEPVSGSNADLVYTKMRDILSYINSDLDTPYRKLSHLYDYIIDTVLYDYSFTDDLMKSDKDSQDLFRYKCLYLEGVFGVQNNGTFDDKKRVAICDGLSKAYMCMAVIEGIPCIKVSGTVNGEGHAWNKAKIGSNWYMIDTTWGNELKSNVEYLSHDYFLIKDDAKHVENPYVTYPEATSDYKAGTPFFSSFA